jgi:ketosteroid isomerase-like protein
VRENAAVRFLEAFNAHDLPAMEAMLTPDVRCVLRSGATIEGRDALMTALAAEGQPGSRLDELTVSVAGRTVEVVDDTVMSTVRRDYRWRESGEFSHSMLARTALTFRGAEIAVIEEFAAERVEG